MALEDLRKNGMMTHLLDALDDGQDIGHYGRLVFAIIARHFVDEDELVQTLAQDEDFGEAEAKSLVKQVSAKDYSPPSRETILGYQEKQDFAILPDTEDPDAGNVYQDLTFPDDVYEHISEYYEHKV
ncbi:hypothetical protein BH24DEI2_BH24DEI2_14270 [soil metagenome]